MPETRYIKEFTDGVLTAEIPYQISDEELGREIVEKVVSELSTLPDAELTTTRLRKLVKALARLRR